MEESMWCGNSIYSQQHYYDGRNSGVTRDDNGLITEFWEDYYPEDPNPKPRPEPETDSIGNELEILYLEDYVPRLSTAIRTVKFTVEYEYFE